jgi:hypothetical protein
VNEITEANPNMMKNKTLAFSTDIAPEAKGLQPKGLQ